MATQLFNCFTAFSELTGDDLYPYRTIVMDWYEGDHAHTVYDICETKKDAGPDWVVERLHDEHSIEDRWEDFKAEQDDKIVVLPLNQVIDLIGMVRDRINNDPTDGDARALLLSLTR